LGLVVAQVG
jgi:hypothetical protein